MLLLLSRELFLKCQASILFEKKDQGLNFDSLEEKKYFYIPGCYWLMVLTIFTIITMLDG